MGYTKLCRKSLPGILSEAKDLAFTRRFFASLRMTALLDKPAAAPKANVSQNCTHHHDSPSPSHRGLSRLV
jgi:hypothetical protein